MVHHERTKIRLNDDDGLRGSILSRREVIALLSGSGAALLTACAPVGGTPASSADMSATSPGASSPPAGGGAVATPSCVVRPALTEGPYFVDEKLDRSDIRSDPASGVMSPGTPLALTFALARVGSAGCTTLAGAQVDVWHCDALGVYSDVGGASGKKFLRGFQRTDASGRASFTTIYPGWYPGRAVHIHFKIRTPAANGAAMDFTSQFFFEESVTDQVYAQMPYTQRPGSGRLRNEGDGIHRGGGDKLLLRPAKTTDGYAVTFDIGLAL